MALTLSYTILGMLLLHILGKEIEENKVYVLFSLLIIRSAAVVQSWNAVGSLNMHLSQQCNARLSANENKPSSFRQQTIDVNTLTTMLPCEIDGDLLLYVTSPIRHCVYSLLPLHGAIMFANRPTTLFTSLTPFPLPSLPSIHRALSTSVFIVAAAAAG